MSGDSSAYKRALLTCLAYYLITKLLRQVNAGPGANVTAITLTEFAGVCYFQLVQQITVAELLACPSCQSLVSDKRTSAISNAAYSRDKNAFRLHGTTSRYNGQVQGPWSNNNWKILRKITYLAYSHKSSTLNVMYLE